MKKITSQDTIPFAVSGTEKFVITPQGVLASDFAAGVLKDRLGNYITVIDMEPDTIVPTPEATPVEPAPIPEPLPAEALAPEAPAEVVEEAPAPAPAEPEAPAEAAV